MSTAMRSAADMEEVGWPEPAAADARTESTRSCCPSSPHWVASMTATYAATSVSRLRATSSSSSLNEASNFSTPSRSSVAVTSS